MFKMSIENSQYLREKKKSRGIFFQAKYVNKCYLGSHISLEICLLGLFFPHQVHSFHPVLIMWRKNVKICIFSIKICTDFQKSLEVYLVLLKENAPKTVLNSFFCYVKTNFATP